MIPTDLLFKKWRAYSVPDDILNEQLLVESRYTDAVATATNLKRILSPGLRAQLSEEQQDEIGRIIAAALKAVSKSDPTGQNAYLPWVAKATKTYLKKRFDELERRVRATAAHDGQGAAADVIRDYFPSILESMVSRLDRLAAEPSYSRSPSLHRFHILRERNLVPSIELFKTYEEYTLAVDQATNEGNRRDNEIEQSKGAEAGTDMLVDDDEFQMMRPLNTAASCKYGQGTKWCTSASTSHNYFDQYTGEGKAFYYLTFKNLMPDDEQRQLALVYTNVDRYDAGSPEEVYDRVDDEVGEEAVYEAAFRNAIAGPLKEIPFYQELMARYKSEIKLMEKEMKSLRSELGHDSSSKGLEKYPWIDLSAAQQENARAAAQSTGDVRTGPNPQFLSAKEREEALKAQGKQGQLDAEQRLFDVEGALEDKKEKMRDEISDLISSTEETLTQGYTDGYDGAQSEEIGPLLRELAKALQIQVTGEAPVDALADLDDESDTVGIDTIEELYEIIKETSDEQVGEIFGEASYNLENNPAGPSPEDFDKILSEFDYKHIYVNEPEDYGDGGRYYWSAGATIDLDRFFEEDEWATDDDYEIADVAGKVLDDHNIYPSETRIESYGGAHELYMDFSPDYNETDGLDGFERFCNTMADYDDGLDRISEEDWREAFSEADVISSPATANVAEEFNELNLEHFQVDVEKNQIEIATALQPTITLPRWVSQTDNPLKARQDIWNYLYSTAAASNHVQEVFLKKMHGFIARELKFMLAQTTIPGIGGSPDFGEDEALEQLVVQFANGGINLNLIGMHDFVKKAEASAVSLGQAGHRGTAQVEYWFQIEIDMKRSGTDPEDIPILKNLARYLDQDRVYRWIGSYLEKTINTFLGELNYREHVLGNTTPAAVAAAKKREEEYARTGATNRQIATTRPTQGAATAPATTVQAGESIPGVFGEPEDLSESLIFEVEKLLRNL
tara:strand:+ start:1683 stop:4565 length:2883 start_codon:yes stop_codon:yes gene_type:complete